MTDEVIRFEIAKLELHEGDSLVVKVDEVLTLEQTIYVREKFKSYLPDEGYQVIVLGRGMSLEVLCKQ